MNDGWEVGGFVFSFFFSESFYENFSNPRKIGSWKKMEGHLPCLKMGCFFLGFLNLDP